MPSTPFNTPRGRSDQEVVRDLGTGKPYVSSGHHHSATAKRVGGGFDTTHLLKGVISEEDRLASEWRAMEYRGNPISSSTAKSGSFPQDLNSKAAQVAQPYNETLEHFLAERKSNRLASNSFLAKDVKTAAQLSGSEVFEFSKMDTRRQFVGSPGGSSTLHHQHLSANGSRHASPGAASSSGRQKSRLLGKLGLPNQPPYSSAHHTNLSSHMNASQGQIYAPHTTFQPLLSAAESHQASTTAAASGALVPVNTSTTSLQQHQHHHQSFTAQSNSGGYLNESHVGAEPVASPIRARDEEADHHNESAVDLMRHTVSSQGKLRSVREKEIADAKLFSERYVSQQYDTITRDSKADGAIDANSSSFHAPNHHHSQHQQQQQHLRHFNPSANTGTSFAAATIAPDVTGNNIPGNTTTQGQGSNYTVTNSSMLRVLKNSNHLVSRVVERSGVSLSCCGGGGKAPPAAGTNVNGLFVSYCQNDVHVQLENARRRLEMEEGAREYDNDIAHDRIAALTAENQQQAAELEQLRLALAANDARFRGEVSDLTTLKEEYAVRFREANEKLEKVQSEKQADADVIHTLQRDLSNGGNKTAELERTIQDLKTNLAAAEAQLVNNAKYTTLAHEDKVRALAEAKEFKNQLSYFTEKMKTKDQLLRGSETALKFVEGKLAATHHINSRQQANNRSRN